MTNEIRIPRERQRVLVKMVRRYCGELLYALPDSYEPGWEERSGWTDDDRDFCDQVVREIGLKLIRSGEPKVGARRRK